MKNILLISKYSFRDTLRSKLMVNAIWMSLGVLLLTYVTSEFSYGNVSKIALDFGLSLSSLATNFIAIFIGASLISNEIENRTAYITLSRPVSRIEFILGKILGATIFLLTNICLISCVALVCYLAVGGNLHWNIFTSIIFSLCEAIILLLVVINFSLIANKTISIINTLAIFLLGHAIPSSLELTFVKNRPILEFFLNGLTYILPNLDKINLKNSIILGMIYSKEQVLAVLLYGVLYIIFLAVLSILIFNKKELN